MSLQENLKFISFDKISASIDHHPTWCHPTQSFLILKAIRFKFLKIFCHHFHTNWLNSVQCELNYYQISLCSEMKDPESTTRSGAPWLREPAIHLLYPCWVLFTLASSSSSNFLMLTLLINIVIRGFRT